MRFPGPLAALGWLVCASSAAAQNPQTLPSPGSPVLQAVRLAEHEAVRVDGVLDEAAWERVAPATHFVQRDPDNGAPATEQTEVRILYDEARLLIGVVCHDSEPARVLGNQMQRDQSFGADDRFMWTIDSFLDGRSGYFFEINPSGAMGDGLIDPSAGGGGGGGGGDLGGGVNKSWDGIWLARVRRTPGGWTAEIEIPFRTLNFDPASSAWGVNFQRTVRRKNEESLWTGHARNQGLARMSNAGRVVGFSGLSQGLGLDIKPYVVGSVSAAPGRGDAGRTATGDVGLDVFYNLTPALRANISLNTDFAETEVDQREVNLTRFPLFFEEKRDFFLEGSSFFDFGREPGNAVLPFFSRRIGLDEEGRPQRIDLGAKLTGQAGPFDVGVLQVRTAEHDLLPGEDFSVVRVRRRAFQQSYIGGIYTRRSARAPGDVDRHTAGVDFELQTSTFRGSQNLELSGNYLWTSNPLETGNSGAYALRFSYPNDPLSARISVRELQDFYDPAIGFYERRGYRRMNPVVEWNPRPANHPWIRSFQFGINFDIQNDTANRPLTRAWRITAFDVNTHAGDSFRVEVTPTYERLEEDFEISDGVTLPEGERYRFTRYQLSFFGADHRIVKIQPQIEFGDFFSGTRRQYTLEIGLRPRRGVNLTLEAERNTIDLAEGSFDTDVLRASAATQFSPWTSLVNNVQYDSESRVLGWQMRFRWIRRPGNDLFVVYSHNWQEFDRLDEFRERRFATLDNRLAMKAVYTLRF